MAGNIPGTNGAVLPGVFTDVETLSRGASVPGGIRIAAIIGEGSANEVIVSGARGGGKDGLDPTYSTTNGADGRHFALSQSPIISNRTSLFRNGLPLHGLEGTITPTTTFSNVYDYMIDITTGHILLQQAHLVDQGGTFWSASVSNVGIGVINALTLLDVDAPSESWSIKCISVQRNGLNQPIAGTAKFIAIGTVSGNKLDANGNVITWTANNTTASNGILQFSIQETASTPFREGDSFLIEVNSGVLNTNDTLTATYIPTANLNDPTFLQSMNDITKKHGATSLDNNLSLGCQLAFANGAPGIMCDQAAPALPRRTSYVLDTSVPATSVNPEDFIFPLPVGVVPDLNAAIHFFVTDPVTNVEKQLLPNKFPYYTLGTAGNPTTDAFIFDNVNPPAGNSFSYSVIQNYETLVTAEDGYMYGDLTSAFYPFAGVFSSGITFDSTYVGKVLNVTESKNVANIGQFYINSVVNGKLDVRLIQPLSVTNDPPTVPATIAFATSFLSFVTSGTIPVPGQFGYFAGNTTAENATETFELTDEHGNLIAGSNGTDGFLTDTGSGNATFHSVAVNLSSFAPLANGYFLKVAGSTYNNGSYIVTADNGSGTLTITKAIMSDGGMQYEVFDTTVAASNYVVVNHNIVPNNNQLRVTIVDARDASFFDAGWLNALAALEGQEIDILVTLPKQTISVIFQNALTHCKTMSSISNKKERVLFLGAINGLTPDNLTGAKLAAVEDIGILEGIQGNTVAEILAGNTEDLANYSVADAFGNTFRAVYFFPDQIVVQVGADNLLIDGFYIAAAAAGFESGTTNIAMPLTNKVLSGLTILRNRQFSPIVLEQLVNAGVTVLQPVTGGGKVVWGITTSQSGFVEEQEISIVFIRDHIAKTMRAGFAAFVGLPQSDSLGSQLTARAVAILNSYISQGLITAYKDLVVVQDSVDPTQWDISVRVQPVYPVNLIFIKVSVGLL